MDRNGREIADWPRLDPTPRAAFLDVDGTLLPRTTSYLFAERLRRQGLLRRRAMAWSAWHGLMHRFGRLDYKRLIRTGLDSLGGVSVLVLERTAYECFVHDVRPLLYSGVTEHLSELRQAGCALVLVSSSPALVIAPLGIYLGCEELLTTPLRVERDRIVGLGEGPACYGEGKAYWAERWAAARGIRMDETVAYADNWSDRVLLERAGRAVVVHPRGRLLARARERQWTVVRPDRPKSSSGRPVGEA